MDERAGCAVLKRHFEAAGLTIVEHHRLTEGGVDIALDGYDPAARIGYEYITTAAGDRAEITPEVVAALEARMAAGEMVLFLIDELDGLDEASLGLAADRFLAHLKQLGKLPPAAGGGTP